MVRSILVALLVLLFAGVVYAQSAGQHVGGSGGGGSGSGTVTGISADSGGTTTGATVGINGGGAITTSRSSDTITVTSTGGSIGDTTALVSDTGVNGAFVVTADAVELVRATGATGNVVIGDPAQGTITLDNAVDVNGTLNATNITTDFADGSAGTNYPDNTVAYTCSAAANEFDIYADSSGSLGGVPLWCNNTTSGQFVTATTAGLASTYGLQDTATSGEVWRVDGATGIFYGSGYRFNDATNGTYARLLALPIGVTDGGFALQQRSDTGTPRTRINVPGDGPIAFAPNASDSGTDNYRFYEPGGIVGTSEYMEFIVPDLGVSETYTFRYVNVVAETTTSHTVTAAETKNSFHTFTNAGAGTYTLPTAVTGMNLCFYNLGSSAIFVDPSGSEVITLDGTALTGGFRITSTGAAGESICLIAVSTGNWVTTNKAGTWSSAGS